VTIHTVLGPIPAETLGPTSMHEHVLSDLSLWSRPSPEPRPPGVEMGPRLRSWLSWNALSDPANLRLDDPEVAVEELAEVALAGGSAIVDLTLPGMGGDLEALPAISRRSGVAICVGTGFYVEAAHPEHIRDLDVDALTEILVAQLDDGIGPSRIRPALIGEIGSSSPISDAEWRVIRAAGRAGARTGATVSMHLSFRERAGLRILETLVDEGMPPDRVILGHLDENFDREYHLDLARAGAMLGYDTFGSDFHYGSVTVRNPTDSERLEMVAMLIEEGVADRLVIGADVWTQANLRRNGGNGYDHLFRRIGPSITEIAADGGALEHQILVANPRRLLDRP
jgi:phosphotriesterase-related protein